jgi:hypothetical protein
MRTFIILASSLLLFSAVAQAQVRITRAPQPGFNFFLGGGIDLNTTGNFHQSGSGELLSLPVNIVSRSFGDIYGSGRRIQAGVEYSLDGQNAIGLTFNYVKARGGSVLIGDIGGLDLRAEFSDYNAYGLDLTYRRMITTIAQDLRPYFGGTLGMKSVSGIDAIIIPGGEPFETIAFYDSSTVGVIGALLGFEYSFTPSISLGLETGIRYSGNLSSSEVPLFEGSGLEGINTGGKRVSIPVLVRLIFEF